MKFRRREVIIQPTHRGLGYEDGEVQLAARRALATMTLEDIPTTRNRLSNEILRDVKEAATTYGFTVLRADVKDLVFPGKLQEIMSRVLAAEGMSQAHAQPVLESTFASTSISTVGKNSPQRRIVPN